MSNNDIRKIREELLELGIELYIGTSGGLMITKPELNTSEIKKKYGPHGERLLSLLKGEKSKENNVNTFKSSLAKGNNAAHRPFLEAVYKKVFPDYDNCVITRSGNTIAQRNGVDIVIYTTSDTIYKIDEKLRYKCYDDIALEFISNDVTRSPGWMEKDLKIDYINYVFTPRKQSYMFPWQQLKIVWDKNKANWIELAGSEEQGFFIARAPNPTYDTLSCAIPTDLLVNLVKETIITVNP